MKRAVAWVVAAVLLAGQVYAVQAWGAEKVQERVYILTAATSVLFMALYSRDPWWRTWFGRSLMLLAGAVFLYGTSVVLYRVVGTDYPGHDLLIVVTADATLAAMVMRTLVLRGAQKRDHDETKGQR